MKKLIIVLIFTLITVTILCGSVSATDPSNNTLITTGNSGNGGNEWSEDPVISDDGNTIAFSSMATDLIPGITVSGNYSNIYVYDKISNKTTLVTNGSSGNGGNGWSVLPSISGDGKTIAFQSTATNLINGMTANGYANIFIYNTITRTTTLVTNGSSGNGGDGNSHEPSINTNGKMITFASYAIDLIPNHTSNGNRNIFLYNLDTGAMTLITNGSSGNGGNGASADPSITGSGNKIVFASEATDLTGNEGNEGSIQNIFLYDANTGIISQITNGNHDSYVPSISSNGNRITFASRATNLLSVATIHQNIFVYDIGTHTLSLITKGSAGNGGNDNSYKPAISGNGNTVSFESEATDLIQGMTTNQYTQVFLYDINTAIMHLITTGANGNGGNGHSYDLGLSYDGNMLVYYSAATDLIQNFPTTQAYNIFLYNREPPVTPDNSNTGQTATAATVTTNGKTITMQETGIPIAGLLLAVLMLFGGLVRSKNE